MKNGIVYLLFILLLSACNTIPDHAKHIPGDALVVVGVNTKEIGKKIAWNAIMGSKLLEEMQKEKTGKAVYDPSEMGLELMSTAYIYVKPDNRFKNGSRVTALVPLESADKWEDFVNTTFPGTAAAQKQGYKELMLADGMYAGWSSELLVIMNTFEIPATYINTDSLADTTTVAASAAAPDISQLAMEMDKTFKNDTEHSLVKNARFKKMEKAAHDISLWINYNALMDQYMSNPAAGIGLPLSNTLWKDAALSAGFDFEKGQIAGNILYYVPESLEQAAKELGKTNADKEMIEMLPAGNLDMLMAWHLSPQGVKTLLEKTGLLGFINLALSGQDLSADYILQAFTGDMAVALNDFKLVKTGTGSAGTGHHDSTGFGYSGDMHFTYALKIDKKENFNKLLQLATATGSLVKTSQNTYNFKGTGAAILQVGEKYCVITNEPANAAAFLSGDFKKQPKPAATKEITGNPFGAYFNARGMMNAVGHDISASAADAAMLAESKKLLENVYFTGGRFKSSAFAYQMSINFVNQSENSLLQLMDFATKMNKARAEALTAEK